MIVFGIRSCMYSNKVFEYVHISIRIISSISTCALIYIQIFFFGKVFFLYSSSHLKNTYESAIKHNHLFLCSVTHRLNARRSIPSRPRPANASVIAWLPPRERADGGSSSSRFSRSHSSVECLTLVNL